MRFVIAAEKDDEPFAGVCRRFGVSRRIGYKWLARYIAATGCANQNAKAVGPEDNATRCPQGPQLQQQLA
jgi:hypothetical protein